MPSPGDVAGHPTPVLLCRSEGPWWAIAHAGVPESPSNSRAACNRGVLTSVRVTGPRCATSSASRHAPCLVRSHPGLGGALQRWPPSRAVESRHSSRAAPINPSSTGSAECCSSNATSASGAPEARGTFSASASTSPSRCGSSSTQRRPRRPRPVEGRTRGGLPAARTSNRSHQQQVVGPARHAPLMRSIHHRVPFTRAKPPAAALEEEPGRWTADQPGKCPAGQVRDMLTGLGMLLAASAGHFLAVHINCRRPSNVHPTATECPGPLGRPSSADARADEAALVRQDHGVHPVAQLKLGEDAGDVGLHRGLAEEQLGRDLGVRAPPRDEAQHF
ncbi:MAG: hypothetical protein JWO67_1301 [Streptosporangiaceae bacterium]|nr:hypothetical protein [Streptosporangiaceae bacterium]